MEATFSLILFSFSDCIFVKMSSDMPCMGNHLNFSTEEASAAIVALADARFRLEEALEFCPQQHQGKLEATIQTIESLFTKLKARGISPGELRSRL